MERDNLLDRITMDPAVSFGRPCIRGHRIWVSLILDLPAGGTSTDESRRSEPQSPSGQDGARRMRICHDVLQFEYIVFRL
jgi:Protein of unknown function (DUF433)